MILDSKIKPTLSHVEKPLKWKVLGGPSFGSYKCLRGCFIPCYRQMAWKKKAHPSQPCRFSPSPRQASGRAASSLFGLHSPSPGVPSLICQDAGWQPPATDLVHQTLPSHVGSHQTPSELEEWPVRAAQLWNSVCQNNLFFTNLS